MYNDTQPICNLCLNCGHVIWTFTGRTVCKACESVEVITHPNYILGKLGMACTLIAIGLTILTGCESNPTQAAPARQLVDTRFVSDTLTSFKSCWYPTSSDSTRDSLVVSNRHYTVSAHSRYRTEPEPQTFGDVEAEGPVTLINPHFYLDTKTANDSIIVLNRCEVK